MSVDNDVIFNTFLILTAGIVDTFWYLILTFLVTSNLALEFIRNKGILIQKIIGDIFIIIGAA